MDNRNYWVWLSLALNVATPTYQRILSHFHFNINEIYDAEASDLCDIRLTPKQRSALLDKSLDEAEMIVDWCDNHNVKILCFDDQRYPKRLASIPDAPVVLYYIGELYHFDEMLCIAGIGTRQMSRYGRDSAYAFCHDLARSGAVVVSGMANGIDTVCHRAALDAGGKTVAVLGCRINKVYPSNNRDIMAEIARKGLLITEFHPFYKTAPANFAKRNRIISGLCQGTIVFEADAGSGSLITAKNAIKQGRKVFALPGEIGNSGSIGTNRLISDGATIAVRSMDIIDEYKYDYPELKSDRILFDLSPQKKYKDSFSPSYRKDTLPLQKADTAENKITNEEETPKERAPVDISSLTPVETKIYNSLSYDKAISAEQINVPEASVGEIMSAYTMLELKGFIKALPGNKYIKQ